MLSTTISFFILTGLIPAGLADRVGDNLVALVKKADALYVLVAAMLALTLGGCAASSVDVQSDPGNAIMVSGQAGAGQLLASAEAAPIPNAHDTLAANYEMPFVRSQPKA